jgi:hypothetical protein
MLSYELVQKKGLLIIQPHGPLRAEDFEALGNAVDEYIVNEGALNGVMITAKEFPGWEDFNALLSHVKFVRANNADLDKVAAVTDSTFLTIMPKIANLFISAEVRHFDFDAREEAMDWLTSGLARD